MVQQTDGASEKPDDARSLGKKRDILRAASEVFRRKGLHATGMREIAAQAGMHASNLYYYFENKQEILAFCQQDSLSELLEMATAVEAAEIPSHHRLFRLIVEHVRVLNESIPGSLAHLEVEALEQPWRRKIQRQRDQYEGIVRAIVRQGQREGTFRETDPKVAALVVLGALNWTVKWYQPSGRRSAEAIGQGFAEILVRGLLADGVRLGPDSAAES